jgi:hypothetical protein
MENNINISNKRKYTKRANDEERREALRQYQKRYYIDKLQEKHKDKRGRPRLYGDDDDKRKQMKNIQTRECIDRINFISKLMNIQY